MQNLFNMMLHRIRLNGFFNYLIIHLCLLLCGSIWFGFLKSDSEEVLTETTQQQQVAHRMILCAKVGNEAPYLVEWLEFHMIQGVTKFVLYLDDIPMAGNDWAFNYYLKNYYPVEIHSLKNMFIDSFPNLTDNNPGFELPAMHRLSQHAMLRQCASLYGHMTEWIIHIDVDEFLYPSANYHTLAEYLQDLHRPDSGPANNIAHLYQKNELAVIYVAPVNYGLSSDRFFDFRVKPSIHSGYLQLLYDSNIPGNTGVSSFFFEVLRSHLNNSLNEGIFKFYSELIELEKRGSPPQSTDYPLIIEDQIFRLSLPVLKDSIDDLVHQIIELYPECQEWSSKLLLPENSYLSKNKLQDAVKILGNYPNIVCYPGKLPSYVTSMGKSIFWTGLRFQNSSHYKFSPSLVQFTKSTGDNNALLMPEYNNLFEGSHSHDLCIFPWVHLCSHNTQKQTIAVELDSQLRLDHHSMRSVEHRTLGESKWRNQYGLGKYNVKDGHTIWKLFSTIQDRSKFKYIEEIRANLARFQLKKVETKSFIVKSSNEEDIPSVITFWLLNRCSSNTTQIRCPESHPHVGEIPLLEHLPYFYCIDSLPVYKSTDTSKYGDYWRDYCPDEMNKEACDIALKYIGDYSNVSVISCPQSQNKKHTCCDASPKT